jgi:hypothetical protein
MKRFSEEIAFRFATAAYVHTLLVLISDIVFEQERQFASFSYLFCEYKDPFLSAMFIKLNSVAGVRERTIPTERPPLFGEFGATFCG